MYRSSFDGDKMQFEKLKEKVDENYRMRKGAKNQFTTGIKSDQLMALMEVLCEEGLLKTKRRSNECSAKKKTNKT